MALCLNPDGAAIAARPAHICHESAELLRELDYITTKHILAGEGKKKTAQCFAVLLPVTAHERKRFSVAIRAVCTTDFMTARPAIPGEDFPADALKSIRDKILSSFGSEISMVLYDLTGKPPATVEWE